MITISNLRLQRGTTVLLKDANARIDATQRVGIVGRNGTGKSSLFALLRGELLADAGNISIPEHCIIAHVAQETPESTKTALNYVLAGDTELTALNVQLAQAEATGNGDAIGAIYAELTRIDAYTAPSRAAQLLDGLGFSQTQQSNAVKSFSGGWRMRLNLARALMCRSDLLLLDEPTNHLDLDTVLWLESYLKNHPATLMIISHDRDFLDALCTHIIEITQQTLVAYKGNYSTYERTRAERLMQQTALYEQQQRQATHLRQYIDRFRAKATKARQAQSRIKALSRLELVAPAHSDSPFSVEFHNLSDLPNPQIQVDKISLGYDKNILLKNISFTIQSQDRIGLLGMNGAGKSTLIKALAGELPALSGDITSAPNLRIGYFSQQHLDTLRENESPLWHLQQLTPSENGQKLRNYLGGFNICGNMATEAITYFSGGEKARLALALLIWQKPHLLLLDEPTNHLDLDMRHALVVALQQFDGALVMVSHDRSLLASCVNDFWLVADSTVSVFDGDLDDYRSWCAQRWQLHKQNNHVDTTDKSINKSKPAHTKSTATLQFEQKTLKRKIAKLEKQMVILQDELDDLHHWLTSEEAYDTAQKERFVSVTDRLAQLNELLKPIEEEWLCLNDELESLL